MSYENVDVTWIVPLPSLQTPNLVWKRKRRRKKKRKKTGEKKRSDASVQWTNMDLISHKIESMFWESTRSRCESRFNLLQCTCVLLCVCGQQAQGPQTKVSKPTLLCRWHGQGWKAMLSSCVVMVRCSRGGPEARGPPAHPGSYVVACSDLVNLHQESF